MHPLIVNLENIKTHELEEKIAELSKKYFLTHNPDLQFQIVSIIDEYKNELSKRRQDEWNKIEEKRDKGLDKLIKID
jgi:hypothetical protein